ncbi:MAG: ABC transporter permease [Myxococcota bacterium]
MSAAALDGTAPASRGAFGTAFAHEWRAQWRRPFPRICLLLNFGIAFGDALQVGLAGGGQEWVNGGATISGRALILSVLGVLAAAGIVGESMARDRSDGIEPLVLSTGAGRTALAGARFAASFTVVVIATSGFVPGMLLGSLFPGIDPEMLGPLRLDHYARALALFIVPNAFVMSAAMYAVSARWRKQSVAFGAALGLVALYVGTQMLLGRDAYRHDVLPYYAMLDPFGGIASAEFVMGWTVDEANRRFVPFAGLLAWNRLAWTGIALALVLAGTRFFSLEQGGTFVARRPILSAFRRPRSGRFTRFGPAVTLVQWELVQLWRSPIRSLALAFAVLTTWWVAGSAETNQFSLPTTDLLVHNTNYYFDKVLTLVIAWLAGELVGRDRDGPGSALIDTRPVSPAARFAAKVVALVAVVLAFWAVSIAVNVTYQATHGVRDLELWLHLFDTFLVKAPYTVWLAVLALVLQIVIRRRFVAMGCFGLVWALPSLLDAIGATHPLYRFGEAPFFFYSNMDGYGHFLGPHFAFVGYWAITCALLGGMALLVYAPGGIDRPRRALARDRLRSRSLRLALATTGLLWLGALGALVWQTVVLHPWPLPKPDAVLADVERALRDDWRTTPQPQVVEIETRIDLEPEARRASVSGRYLVTNPWAEPIDRVLILREPSLAHFEIAWDDAVEAVRAERHPRLGYEIWSFGRALRPGDEAALDFALSVEPPPGFAAHGPNDFVPEVGAVEVVGNGTSLLSLQLLPMVGYSEHVEHKPAWKRRRHGLEDAWTPPANAGRASPHATAHAGWLRRIETTVSTSADQIPLHSGTQVALDVGETRTTARYVLEGPVRAWTQIVSARWSVEERTRAGLPPVEIYHHPAHDRNVDAIGEALLDGLGYFSSRFGPAPIERFRFAEQSLHFDSRGARQGLGFGTEVLGWKSDLAASEGLDLLEMAGQLMGMTWFSDQIVPANAPGAKVLHAGLPYWTGALFVHERLSPARSRAWRRQEMAEMFRSRRGLADADAPFDVEWKDSTMVRRKGALLLIGLAEAVGRARVERAIAAFLDEWRDQGPPYPTADDFIGALERALPESEHAALHDFFRTVPTWHLSVAEATCRPAESGGWSVEAVVEAKQIREDAPGGPAEVPITPGIEVALFERSAAGDRTAIAQRRHRLDSGRTVLRWSVDRPPTEVAIDPGLYLPDPLRYDDAIEVRCDVRGV